jgi:hypothetical protein
MVGTWRKRGLPVVAVQDICRPDLLGHFQRRTTEFSEPLGIVGIVHALYPVELFAVEIFRVIYKEIAHTVDHRAIGDGGKAQHRPQGNRQAGHQHLVDPCSPVARQHHGDLMAQLDQRLRKPLDDIGQPARLRERQAFGRNEQDAHRVCSKRKR